MRVTVVDEWRPARRLLKLFWQRMKVARSGSGQTWNLSASQFFAWCPDPS